MGSAWVDIGEDFVTSFLNEFNCLLLKPEAQEDTIERRALPSLSGEAIASPGAFW
jgi:hypothetical protein